MSAADYLVKFLAIALLCVLVALSLREVAKGPGNSPNKNFIPAVGVLMVVFATLLIVAASDRGSHTAQTEPYCAGTPSMAC